jgi:hypothetical protein
MAASKSPTKRKTITIAEVTLRRLNQLALGGWFGSDAAGIATRFIEDGVRDAREKGYLDKPPKRLRRR